MDRVRGLSTELQVHRGWASGPGTLDALRRCFEYAPGDDRTTGVLYGEGRDWPGPLATLGPALLDNLERLLGVRFEIVAFQAYMKGSGCDWHTDPPFDVQAVLSLGVTRTFGVRLAGGIAAWYQVGHGDLVVMPSGFQDEYEHCVPVEDATGERCSLVFRTVKR